VVQGYERAVFPYMATETAPSSYRRQLHRGGRIDGIKTGLIIWRRQFSVTLCNQQIHGDMREGRYVLKLEGDSLDLMNE